MTTNDVLEPLLKQGRLLGDRALGTLPDQGVTATPFHAATGHERRLLAPWYAGAAEPATADMAAKLRRVIIAVRFWASRLDQPASEELSLLRLAWEDAEPLAA